MGYKVRYGNVTAELTRADLERAPGSLLSSALLPVDPESGVHTILSTEQLGTAANVAGWRGGSENLFKVKYTTEVIHRGLCFIKLFLNSCAPQFWSVQGALCWLVAASFLANICYTTAHKVHLMQPALMLTILR